MRRLPRLPSLLLLLCLSVLAAGAIAQGGGYRLGAGDLVRVDVYENPDLATLGRLSEAGVLGFPLLGEVTLAGLTEREAATRIAERLSAGRLVRDPQVSLTVEGFESQQVAILGAVARPGRYPVQPGSTVLDLLAEAGGLRDEAGERVVLRRSSGERRELPLTALLQGEGGDADLALRDGDRLFVPSGESFFVYGQVNRPGVYRLQPGMTVMQALSVAGGLTDKGTERGLTISRTPTLAQAGTQDPVAIPAQLDQRVQPGDVVHVRESLF